MSQGTSTESATRTATADSPSAPAHTRKKRGCGGCFLILFLLVLLVVAGTGFGYWLIQNGSQRNLRDQLAAAATAGSANTLEQVQQMYAVPAGTLDTTANWNSATDVFNTDEYDRARGNLPIVTTNETPRWPPLEWRDRDAAEALVDKFRGKLIELQLAAVGPAAWPVDFADNWRLADDVINEIWRGFYLMELNCYVAAHRRNVPELVRSLAACLTWGNAFALHPAHQNQRLDLETRSLNLLLRVLEKVELTDESLSSWTIWISI